MNWDIVEGNWKQFKGEVKAQWGKLTDDHLDVIAGKRDSLAGQIQESYGITKDQAEEEIKRFEALSKKASPKDPLLTPHTVPCRWIGGAGAHTEGFKS
jgi:uncharacterized protein YjbJ (UPF0337 family)